jgi:Macrophage migration inhibitory factor (MIF)
MVTTEVAMLIGGNSEPAYHVTVTALPSEIAATKNKRSTHLIQDFMQDSLDIKPRRGVVRFEAVAEENLATNGMTALQEIEQLERNSVEDDGILRAWSRQTRRSKKSSIPIASERTKAPTPNPFSAEGTKDSKSTDASGTGRKKAQRRRSILGFFRR